MRKDVVIAEIGAAAALVGFALVFLADVSFQRKRNPIAITLPKDGRALRNAHASATAATSCGASVKRGLASVVLSTTWLVAGGGKTFYVSTLVLFFAELSAVVAVAVYSTSQVLLR